MSWRPAGWGNCPCDGCHDKKEHDGACVAVGACRMYNDYLKFEAGADAMLKMLRNHHGLFSYETFNGFSDKMSAARGCIRPPMYAGEALQLDGTHGTYVFFPDDEVKG